MDCEAYRELIFRCLDGGLSSDEQTVLDAHLAECAECRAVFGALCAASEDMKKTESVPEGFAARVMDAVREEKKIVDIHARREKLKKRFQPGNVAIWVACACLVIMVGIVELTPVGHSKNPTQSYFMADQAAVFEAAQAEPEAEVAMEEAAAVPEEAMAVAEEAAEAAKAAPEMPAEAPAEEAAPIAAEPEMPAPEPEEQAAGLMMNGAARGMEDEAETPDVPVPALMVNGQLYRSTGTQLPVEVDDSAFAGTVGSVVPLNDWPQTEGEANFGAPAAPYAFLEEGLVVLLDGEWTLFEPMAE